MATFSLSGILSEIKRRRVIGVVVLYVVGAWILLQVAALVFPGLDIPETSIRYVLIGTILGLPVALVFGWRFDITTQGVRRTPTALEEKTDYSLKPPDYIVLLALSTIAVAMVFVLTQKIIETQGEFEPTKMAADLAEFDPPEHSIAVLPFDNLSSDPEQEYFSDGLADALLHRLTQIKDLRVAARTSSFKFKGQNEDMRDIARQLGVASVLEGSVQRQGDRVRITAQLIDGSDGSHIWSRVFDDTLDDIFRVQDEIAHNVAGALQTTLGDAVIVGIDLGGTDNVAAYEAYLKGVEYSQRGTPEAASQAIVQLELAVGLDPDYARAWVALSKAYALPAELGTATYASTLIPRMNAAEKAVALAPKLPEAHLALATVLRFDGGDTERAAAAIEKAAELGPNNAESLAALGQLRTSQGLLRDALRLTERAALINSLDPFLQMDLARRKLNVGLEDEALALVARVTETNPENLNLLMSTETFYYIQNQKFVEAARVLHYVFESNLRLVGQ